MHLLPIYKIQGFTQVQLFTHFGTYSNIMKCYKEWQILFQKKDGNIYTLCHNKNSDYMAKWNKKIGLSIYNESKYSKKFSSAHFYQQNKVNYLNKSYDVLHSLTEDTTEADHLIFEHHSYLIDCALNGIPREKVRVGCFKRTASKHVYYLGWNGSPAQVGCMRQVLGPGAMGKPRGSGWRGRWGGGDRDGEHM